MKITICGSSAFRQQMVDYQEKLEQMGHKAIIHPHYVQFVKEGRRDILDRIDKGEHAQVKKENDYIRWYHKAIKDSDAVLILNFEKKGIKNQVVAELNHDVIDLVGKKVEEECPDVNLDLRQGDFKEILIETIKNKEEFEAISIDAFPNSAEDVNCDASNNEVLKLAWKALKPGGILTFYPDSRYIPSRILNILHDLEVPETSIHYTVAKFKTSEFTKNYHYGELMAVPAIQKPLLLWKDNQAKVNELVKEYYNTLDEKISAYVKKHKDELTSTVNDSKDNLEEAA